MGNLLKKIKTKKSIFYFWLPNIVTRAAEWKVYHLEQIHRDAVEKNWSKQPIQF